MSIKSIPLKTWEVQAILDDRKSTMRRVVQPHNVRKAKFCEYAQGSGLWVEDGYIKDYSVSSCWTKIENYISKYAAYKPGDILWVRETWRTRNVYGDIARHDRTVEIEFKAGGNSVFIAVTEDAINGCRWHPSIHMPREAARLFLRVKSVRVERLQEITPDQCAKEGVTVMQKSVLGAKRDYRFYFARLWAINIKPEKRMCYGWDANPFVWAVEFERCERPENFLKEGSDHGK